MVVIKAVFSKMPSWGFLTIARSGDLGLKKFAINHILMK